MVLAPRGKPDESFWLLPSSRSEDGLNADPKALHQNEIVEEGASLSAVFVAPGGFAVGLGVEEPIAATAVLVGLVTVVKTLLKVEPVVVLGHGIRVVVDEWPVVEVRLVALVVAEIAFAGAGRLFLHLLAGQGEFLAGVDQIGIAKLVFRGNSVDQGFALFVLFEHLLKAVATVEKELAQAIPRLHFYGVPIGGRGVGSGLGKLNDIVGFTPGLSHFGQRWLQEEGALGGSDPSASVERVACGEIDVRHGAYILPHPRGRACFKF